MAEFGFGESLELKLGHGRVGVGITVGVAFGISVRKKWG